MIKIFKKQKAIALVMVLMLVTILVVIVNEFAYSCKVDAFISSNQISELKNRYALMSILNESIGYLQLDIKIDEENQDKGSEKEKTYDTLLEPWKKDIKDLKIDETVIEWHVVDESRKFNILSLIKKKNSKETNKDNKNNENNENENNNEKGENEQNKDKDKNSQKQTPKQQFLKLVEVVLGKTGAEAESIHKGIVDWLENKQGKSEDKFSDKVPIYSIKELMLAKGINEAVLFKKDKNGNYTGLINYITIWPEGKININTASKEVLSCLHPKMTSEIIDRVIKGRQEEPIKKTEDAAKYFKEFFNNIKESLCVESQYFTVRAVAETARVRSELSAVLYRDEEKIYTIYCEIK